MNARWIIRTSLVVFGVSLAGVFTACGPKTPEITNYADHACEQARLAQASSEQNAAEYQALLAQISEKQVAKIELERLRSRVRTNRITDLELAEWRQEQERARLAAIADTAQTDTTEALEADVTEGGIVSPDTSAIGELTPSDTTSTPFTDDGFTPSADDTASTYSSEETGFQEEVSDTTGTMSPSEPQPEPSSEGVESSEEFGTTTSETSDMETSTEEPGETTPDSGEAAPQSEEAAPQSGDQSSTDFGSDADMETTTDDMGSSEASSESSSETVPSDESDPSQ